VIPAPSLETLISSPTQTVTISHDRPIAVIGDRINPSGRRQLTASLKAGNMDVVRRDAIAQVQAGAALLDINAYVPGMDQGVLMRQIIQAVREVTDVPLCLDSHSPRVLKAALSQYRGKPLINSVNGKARSLAAVLPLVKEHQAAVIGLAMDDAGLPKTAEQRLGIAARIVERAESLGIPRSDVIVDPVVLTARADTLAAREALKGIRLVVRELGVNVTIGASNLSHGLPRRPAINAAFVAMAIASGVTCPIANPLDRAVRQAIRASSLIMGHGKWTADWIDWLCSPG
jgi:5-methyltetrahydrofolate--homocysteine methyltransferase